MRKMPNTSQARYGQSICLALVFCIFSSGCMGGPVGPSVVVYSSRDKFFAQPVFELFENQTGIRVLAVYDTGITKTAGLANRIIAEGDNPQADVFWNSETARTIKLKELGLLESYDCPNARDVPTEYNDAGGYWSGFGARARLIIYNKDLVKAEDAPHSVMDFKEERFKGRLCVGQGWLGTMATHNGALFLELGDERAREYFQGTRENGVIQLVGNTAVRDAVSRGECIAGLIDSSDAYEAMSYGKKVDVIVPDQMPDEMGALIIPNTVALIRGGPNTANGKRFIDFMQSREIERMLASSASAQIPLKEGVDVPDGRLNLKDIKLMNVDFEKVAKKMDESNKFLIESFT